MQGVREFIIENKHPFIKELSFAGGAKIFIDPSIGQHNWTNRICTVVSVPLKLECEIVPGDEVLIVDTVFFKRTGKDTAVHQSHFLMDKEKGWYRVPQDLIVMYRKDKGPWQCYGENVMLEPVQDKWHSQGGLEIVDTTYREELREYGAKKQHGKVAYMNPDLAEQGVVIGDEVYYKDQLDYKFTLDEKPYYLVLNRDILGVFKKI